MDIDNIETEEYIPILIKLIQEYGEKKMNLILKSEHVLVLDSSDATKQSYHILFRCIEGITEYLFENNKECGHFIKIFLDDLWHYLYSEKENQIFINFETKFLKSLINKEKKSCIDSSIYTTNRCFRLLLSNKLGSNRCLKLYKNNKYFIKNEVEIFDHSFITIRVKKSYELMKLDHTLKTNIVRDQKPKWKQEQNKVECNFYEELIPSLTQYIKSGKINFVSKIKGNYFHVRTNSKYCNYINGFHKTNNVYLLINDVEKMIYFRCYDDKCKLLKHIYYPLQEETYKILEECYLNEQLFNLV